MKRHYLALATGLLLPCLASASNALDLDFTGDMGDDQYKDLVDPLVNPMRHMFMTPAKSTGVIGFDLGLAVSASPVPGKARDIASRFVADGKDIPKNLLLPRLTAQKGLPFGLDLGANFAMVPGTKVKLIGVGAQYQVSLPIPLIGIAARAAYSGLLGLQELSARHVTVEGLVSAGLPPGVSALIDLEPYAGFGMDFAGAKSTLTFTVAGESGEVTRSADWTETYVLAGARLSLGFLRVGGEAQISLGGRPLIVSGKAAVGF